MIYIIMVSPLFILRITGLARPINVNLHNKIYAVIIFNNHYIVGYILIMNNTLSVPTWLYIDTATSWILTKNVCFISFSSFALFPTIHVFNPSMVGLMINPVYGPIAQQPGPIKMRQVTRYLWSYIRNYN